MSLIVGRGLYNSGEWKSPISSFRVRCRRTVSVLRVTCSVSALRFPCLREGLISQDIWGPPFSTGGGGLRRPPSLRGGDRGARPKVGFLGGEETIRGQQALDIWGGGPHFGEPHSTPRVKLGRGILFFTAWSQEKRSISEGKRKPFCSLGVGDPVFWVKGSSVSGG